MRQRLLFLIFSFAISASSNAQIKQRVDLEDVKIKGEAQGNGMNVLSRSKNDISSRVSVRTSYSKEMIEFLPENFYWPEAKMESKKKRFSR